MPVLWWGARVVITFPEPPRASPRAPFPLIAVMAPLVAAVVIGAIIRSPYVLVFAALSPIIAIASAWESRRAARRQARDEDRRFAAECAATEHAIVLAHRAETATAFAPGDDDAHVIVGAAPGESSIPGTPPTVDAHPDSAVRERLRSLTAAAARNPRLPVRVPPGPIEIRGHGVVAERLRERVATHTAPDVDARAEARTVITVTGLAALDIVYPDGTTRRADAVVPFRADDARRQARAQVAAVPDHCDWSEVSRGVSEPGLAVGMGAGGPVILDLIADGPHALVGGATGSGKSEFLRALALSAAADAGSWSVLYVDFKGGATFHDLAELPSTVGLITDLDATLAGRALTSLRAEIERRERIVARERVRDVAELSAHVPRLLVIVDEYAALVSTHPALQTVFSDLSARGRSLGIHLVLCTQRPSGVVNDTVAVNCAIRVLFRTSDAADARALLGADAPAVAAAPRGRAIVRTSDRVFACQVSLIAPSDVAAVAAAAADRLHGDPPWAPVLPAHLPTNHPEVRDARRSGREHGALLVGLVDDVSAQRWSAALWDPGRDGALAIVGCPGSGRTNALAQLVAEARDQGWTVIRLPAHLPDAYQLLAELIRSGGSSAGERCLLVVDDALDLLESDAPDQTAGLLALMDAAIRVLHRSGGGVAAAVGTASRAARLLTGRFGARLQLRALDADDHLAAGAPRGGYNDRAPAGRGWWRGGVVHVVQAEDPLPQASYPRVRTVGAEPLIAVIAVNPVAATRALTASSHGPVRLVTLTEFVTAGSGGDEGAGVIACVGHPDDWQRDWAALAHARRSALIAVDGCDAGDLRAVIAARVQPPPIGPRELWVIEPGQGSAPEVHRARWAARAPGAADAVNA